MSIELRSMKNIHLGKMLPAGISAGLEEPLLFMEFWLRSPKPLCY